MRLLITTVQKLYPSVESFSRDGDTYKAYDKDGIEVTIDKSAIDTEHTKEDYVDVRENLYPNIKDFADAMYWNSKGDSSKLTAYYTACEKVKTDNPKPS